MTRAPGDRGFVLAVTGLTIEARIAAGPGVRVVAGGGRSTELVHAIEREVVNGAAAIASFGVAGALDPALKPGAVIVARKVVTPTASFITHEQWTAALLQRLPAALSANIAGSNFIIAEAAAKARLHEQSDAAAVDMESQIAANIAALHGLPFIALRVIADTQQRSLPSAAKVAMRADGSIDIFAVLGSLARNPAQLPSLLRIARDTQTALRALAHSRRLLGDALGYANLDQLALHVI